MNEEEIKKIFFDQLERSESMSDALVNTGRIIKEKILRDLFFGNIAEDRWELLLELNDAQSRTGYFTKVEITTISLAEPDLFRHYIFLHSTIDKGLRYFLAGFDEKDDSPENEADKNKVSESIKFFNSVDEEKNIEFLNTGKITVQLGEIQIISKLIDLIALYLIGSTEKYDQLVHVVAGPINTLRLIGKQLSIDPGKKIN